MASSSLSHMYPGTAHSGKTTISAPRPAASSIRPTMTSRFRCFSPSLGSIWATETSMRRESSTVPDAVRAIRFYDVVCPYSYMESYALEAAEDAGEVEVTWLPFELRPAPRPLLEVRGDHLRTDWTNNVYARAQARGIEIHLP